MQAGINIGIDAVPHVVASCFRKAGFFGGIAPNRGLVREGLTCPETVPCRTTVPTRANAAQPNPTVRGIPNGMLNRVWK